jgi:hypothetical protein
LNPRRHRVEQPEVIEETEEVEIEVLSPSLEERSLAIPPEVRALFGIQQPTTPPKASAPLPELDIWNRPLPPRPPRLRVGLDYHNVIQVEEWQGNKKVFEGIPTRNIDAVRRLASLHEVYVLSWAPSRRRALEVETDLHRCGLLTAIGGRHHLLVGPEIPAKVTETKTDPRTGEQITLRGKAAIAQDLGIHVLVDDSTDIGDEAGSLGLPFIGIQLPWSRFTHPQPRCGSLVEAIEFILDDPDRWV